MGKFTRDGRNLTVISGEEFLQTTSRDNNNKKGGGGSRKKGETCKAQIPRSEVADSLRGEGGDDDQQSRGLGRKRRGEGRLWTVAKTRLDKTGGGVTNQVVMRGPHRGPTVKVKVGEKPHSTGAEKRTYLLENYGE